VAFLFRGQASSLVDASVFTVLLALDLQ